MRRALSTPGSSKGAYKSGRGRTAALKKKKMQTCRKSSLFTQQDITSTSCSWELLPSLSPHWAGLGS